MEMKRLIIPLTIKAMADDASNVGEFEGYGAVFGNIDFGGDIINRGAFQDSLNEWSGKGMLPQMLWYHNSEEIIGDWTEMAEDEYGLRVKGRLWIKGDLKVDEAVKAYNVLRGTSVKGLSIGYRVRDYETQEQMDGSTVRVLKEIDIMEVSIAPWSMNQKAMVTGVKDINGELKSKREVEKVLREAGLSRRESKAFIAGGYEALCRDGKDQVDADHRDDDLDDGELLASLKQLSTLMETK